MAVTEIHTKIRKNRIKASGTRPVPPKLGKSNPCVSPIFVWAMKMRERDRPITHMSVAFFCHHSLDLREKDTRSLATTRPSHAISFHQAEPGIPSRNLEHQHKKERERHTKKKKRTPTQKVLFTIHIHIHIGRNCACEVYTLFVCCAQPGCPHLGLYVHTE